MSHGRAVALMVVVTLMWSMAGVVTRQLEVARSFEVTFWRSAFNAVALSLILRWTRGPDFWRVLFRAPWTLWVSGVCWAVMYAAFMVAITITTVANVLVTMALGPLMTALFSRIFLRHPLATRTWIAICVAGVGIAWMFGQDASSSVPGAALGTAIALGVPIAAAINWTVLQHAQHGSNNADDPDMVLAVLIGALLSALATLPFAWPLQASPIDLRWLALLGVAQLAIPCMLVVRLTRVLPAPELALLGLLEVIFGVLWAWIGAGEAPGEAALTGGALVIGALVANEMWALRSVKAQP